MEEAFADDLLNRMFDPQGKFIPVREAIVRSEGFGYRFDDWKIMGHMSATFRWLSQVLVDDPYGHPMVAGFADRNASGFFVRAGDWMNVEEELEFMLDELASRLRDAWYVEQMNESITVEQNDLVYGYCKRFFKPSLKRPEESVNYGNVMMETVYREGLAHGFKLLVTTYSGRDYPEQAGMQPLLAMLLKD
jgi:hypothetical protein